jgi:UDP-N-acetylmuramoylalanine--D-glutamate ligase
MKWNVLQRYRDRSVHVVGFSGAEGYAVLSYLSEKGFSNLTAHDIHEGNSLVASFSQSHISMPRSERDAVGNRLLSLPVTYRLGSEYLNGIETADLIFAGQNWFAHPANMPVKRARETGIPVCFLVQLYFDMSPAPIAAVTGTNGKTTVSNALNHILDSAGKSVLMSGNDRYHTQVLDKLETLDTDGVLVLEVSNRQCREIHAGPQVAIITNITPDHIEEHGSFEAYADVKERLFRLQSPDAWAVINRDDPRASRLDSVCPARTMPYSIQTHPGTGAGPGEIGFTICYNGVDQLLFRRDECLLQGDHNLSNLLAAATGAYVLGVEPEQIRKGVKTFSGVRNRLQCVGTVDGVDYIDDQASTNPSATRAALASRTGSVILIAGGDIKGNESDYDTLAQMITRKVKKLFVLDGSIESCLMPGLDRSVPVQSVETLQDAVIQAESIAKPGDTVLLSPAGAGFYSRHVVGKRGFKRLVRDCARRSMNRSAGKKSP